SRPYPLSLHDALPISNIGTRNACHSSSRAADDSLSPSIRVNTIKACVMVGRDSESANSNNCASVAKIDAGWNREASSHQPAGNRSEEHTSELQSLTNL